MRALAGCRVSEHQMVLSWKVVGDVEWVEMRLIWPWHRVEVVGREVAASWRGWGCFGRSIS